MSGFEAFATGFLGATADNINVRKDRADDYFEKQMERARTTGADALAKRRANLKTLTTAANTLRDQGNMPEDVLKVVINEGPETLASVQQLYDTAVSNGVTLDEKFWRDTVQASSEIKASDESLGDFLGRTVGLFGGNLEASKTDGEGGDPISAFVASGLGYNAMDKARSKLDQEDIAGGFSASDLLAMESRPDFDSPMGDLGVTINGAKAVSTLDNMTGGKPLTIDQKTSVNKAFTDRASELTTRLENKEGRDATEEEVAANKQQAASELAELYGVDVMTQVPTVSTYLPQEAEGEVIPSDYMVGTTYDLGGEEGTFVRMTEQGPVFLINGVQELVEIDGSEEPVVEEVPTEEPDPTAASIEQSVQPGGNVEDFAIKGDQIPQTLMLGGKQHWFQSIAEKDGMSYAIFIDDEENEQYIPIKGE